MRKGERLFQLLNILRSRRGVVTSQEIAEQLRVSQRTVYRDIQALSLSNVPIESEAGVGYRLRPGFNLPPLMFEEDELEALMLGVKMVQGWSDVQLGDAANRAFDKIKAILPDPLHTRHHQQNGWLIVPDFHRSHVSRFSDDLRAAIKGKRQIEITYQSLEDKQSRRELWPLGLVFWGRVWTLVAWCQLRQDYRVFRIDRIQQLSQQEVKFQTSKTLSLPHYIAMQESKDEGYADSTAQCKSSGSKD
ncbi:helix-turn-helix transcriptional regulator [Paraglaciecola hydrolytica]|uniref:DNA-binding transcriptional regulator n=1 Tax=Paraglaciecola hydrolytica TaxID=1799789 RepID=A0A136A2A2_9ALTE|nr:YafY family protein [Paraglaciecola hydrolytica]KXI29366.1 DNA-binding transcriptional regulator [Paraglaciecola hydrolytica]